MRDHFFSNSPQPGDVNSETLDDYLHTEHITNHTVTSLLRLCEAQGLRKISMSRNRNRMPIFFRDPDRALSLSHSVLTGKPKSVADLIGSAIYMASSILSRRASFEDIPIEDTSWLYGDNIRLMAILDGVPNI